MGYMDDFAVAHVTPQLQPGESIQWIGCLAHPVKLNTFLTPERYEHYIGVATDRRFIVLEAVTQFFTLAMHGKLKPEVGRGVHVWWFNELGEVRSTIWSLTGVRGFVLDPFISCGPLKGEARRYDVFTDIEGFDRQGYYQNFVEWLTKAVAARSFPIDPAKMPLVQQWEQRQQQRREAAARAAASSKAAGRVFKWIGAILLWAILMTGFGASMVSGAQQAESWGKNVREDEKLLEYRKAALAKLEKGKKPPTKCPYTKFEVYKCICVDDAAHAENNTTNEKRKMNDQVGMWCLDEAGLKSEMSGTETYDKEHLELVAKGKTMNLVGMIGLGVVGVAGLALFLRKILKKQPPPAAPVDGV